MTKRKMSSNVISEKVRPFFEFEPCIVEVTCNKEIKRIRNNFKREFWI